MSEQSESEVSVLAQQMKALQEMMAEFKAALAPFQQQREAVAVDIQAAQERINALKLQDRQIQNQMFDTQREIRKVEQNIDQTDRKLKQAIANEALKNQFAEIQAEFDEITRGAPWREWAMDHQISGGKILANAKRAILGDKRGLGKTLTALITADMNQAKKIVYFSPGDVLRTVEREIAHWAPHRTVAPLGMMPKSQRRYALNMLRKLDEFIITINFEAWRRDKSLLADVVALQCDMVIVDEAHNIKDIDSIGFKGVEQITFGTNICPECGASTSMQRDPIYTYREVPTCDILPDEHYLGSRAMNPAVFGDKQESWQSVKYVLPMTGTPILNRPQDLFALLTLIDRKTFYNQYQFLRDYCEQDIDTGRWKFAYGGLDRLIKKMSANFLVRDRKQAGVVIPPQEIQYYDLQLTEEEYPEQWKFNRQLNEFAALMVDEDTSISILVAIALITRKRQMMTWPDGIKWRDPKTKEVIWEVTCGESIKVDKTMELLSELTADWNMDEGDRVVVFSQFKEPLKEIERRINEIPDAKVVRYDGDTSKHVADQVVVDFDAKYCNAPEYGDKKWQVVLANYKKGGVGLNLTDATHIIILDEEWNPGKVDQAYGRIDRMGQTRETTVHVLRVQNSVDTWMAGIIAEKAEMIDGFETSHNLAQEMIDAIRNGDMI